ncbi:transmembrane protein, putative (macronuclear) [Tetrahymena thermophila SB210]|uniref:Transmembrane protein, putative n=1 Tax=Tetrahymena thermophila (strain SB210) TaxID=312017 RepID=Q22LH5_TETTS|nr:transmembrane protein, putative [Tetrahymena thermophila SB210]EAR86165.1 transmembrane protein, putative [Tetrahymena thermophila SB210]|eukprot:XP_976760.1 transmembrane protein, putative [Tetrahymena thermophila SB210]
MKNLLAIIIIGAIISPYINCIETMSARTDYTQLSTLINFNLGSPAVPLKLQAYFGTLSDNSNLGQFIIDLSIRDTNYQYYEQLYNIGVKKFYSIDKSSTVQIEKPFERKEQSRYGGQISGVYAKDVLSYNKIKSNYQFACVQFAYDLIQIYYNGVIVFNKITDNIFDQMYQENAISTSDYILSGSKYDLPISDTTFIQTNSIDITFDLDINSEYYNNPSNPLVSNSDTFQIMSYGIYLDGEDFTDKIKQKRITLDQLTDQSGKINDTTYIPKDLLEMVMQNYNIPDDFTYRSCNNCQCYEAESLPEISLFTEEYKITIKPDQYIVKYENSCFVNLDKSDNFVISSPLLFNSDIKILYQKQSNSIKIINAKLINHMNLKQIIIIFPILNLLILITLLYIPIKWALNFQSYKLEQISTLQCQFKMKQN